MIRKDLTLITLIYLLSCAIYFIWSIAVTAPGYPLDDSWIHQVFARNLVNGHGFSFNPNSPISGATAPFWTLLMALVWPLAGPLAGGILLGMLLQLSALVAIYLLTQLLCNDRRVALITSILSSLVWVLVWGGLSGMEVGLYSALSLWGLYCYSKAESLSDTKNYLAYLLFILAFLSRPECALFAAFALTHDFFRWIRQPNKRCNIWLWRGLIIVLPLIPYFIFNYQVAGNLLPQTYVAKVQDKGLLSALLAGNFRRIVKALTIFPFFYLLDFTQRAMAVIPFALVTIVPGILKFVQTRDHLRSRRIMLALLVLAYIPLMGMFSPILTATYHNFRLVDNLIPLILLLGVTGIFWPRPIGTTRLKYIFLLAILLALGGIVLFFGANSIANRLSGFFVIHTTSFSGANFSRIIEFVRSLGSNSLLLAAVIFCGAGLSVKKAQELLQWKSLRIGLIILLAGYSSVTMLAHAPGYAYDVKDINDVDKAAGLFLKQHAEPGQLAAVNDIGAIAYFGEIDIFDLKGLVSPEITAEMIVDDSLAFEYMYRNKRVDYLAIFPAWFNYLPKRTDIFKPVGMFYIDSDRETVLAGDTVVVYRAVWPDSIR